MLSADCAVPENQLLQLRGQIISLAMWVARSLARRCCAKADLEPLIDINKTMMEGLRRAAKRPRSRKSTGSRQSLPSVISALIIGADRLITLFP
ncbi:MAG: flagellar biosynthesis regulator FlaF [Hyphomonadaceae bacterium]